MKTRFRKKKLFWWQQSSGSSFDSDYQAWLTQVISDGGTSPSAQIQTAQNNLVLSLKSASLWNRMKTGYFLHCGDTTTGRRNIKNPSTFRTTLSGTLTFSEGNGTKSDGSSYINQNYAANQYAGIESDLTACQYISESSTAFAAESSHGMRFSTTATARIFRLLPKYTALVGATDQYTPSGSSPTDFSSTNHRGLYLHTYDGTSPIIYKNGVKTTGVAMTPLAPNISSPRLICARNINSAGGVTAAEFYSKYIAYDFLFDRFSDADESALRTILTTYNSAAGLP